jgi:hypothetical protein
MRRSSRCVSFATLLLVGVSVGACAMFETGQTKLQGVKTVGIISAVGGEFSFARAGLTGLNNNASQSFPIGAWGLDDLIVQQATTALNGRFQVQPVSYNRAVFAAIEESPVAPVNVIRGDPFQKLIQTEISPQGLDAYIVITKAKSNFGRSVRKVEGIGFVTYGTVLASYNQIHALYEIRVFRRKDLRCY